MSGPFKDFILQYEDKFEPNSDIGPDLEVFRIVWYEILANRTGNVIFDAFLKDLAVGFLEGDYGWDICNYLSTELWVPSQQIIAGVGRRSNNFVWDVFLAFDAGWPNQGDDPIETYTKPQLRLALDKLDRGEYPHQAVEA